MILSIVMPTFARGNLLRAGLLSISNQNIKYKYEIIVLNDATEDGAETICSEFPHLNMIEILKCGLNYQDGNGESGDDEIVTIWKLPDEVQEDSV